jgi:hypothetical protein
VKLRVAIAALCAFAAAASLAETSARADGSERDALLAQASAALEAGRPVEAISAFEALADRGVVDARVSFGRGLAYAHRARIAETPGDLGRAAHGFEEARDLTRDPELAREASRALALVRSEVARRRTRAGEPATVDPLPSLGESIVRLLPENAWSGLALALSIVLGLALFVRSWTDARRKRIGATIAASVSAPLLVATAVCAASARDDRLHRREAIVVAPQARPADDRHVALPSEPPLPEGARVRVLSSATDWSRIRWGTLEAWVPSSALRPLAR